MIQSQIKFLMRRLYGVAFALGLVIACSTSKQTKTSEPTQDHLAVLLQGSRIEVEYILDRDQYRLSVAANLGSVKAVMYRDQSLTREARITDQSYAHYFERAENFLDYYQKLPPNLAFCRRPFRVVVQKGSQSQELQGCRRDQDTTFGKFLREGEFLLYSAGGHSE